MDPLTIVIERAREEDLSGILRVMETANMHHVPSPEMPDLDWECFFVARSGGEIVGAAGYKVLSATNKMDKKSFTVELLTPASYEIKFNWWIVN